MLQGIKEEIKHNVSYFINKKDKDDLIWKCYINVKSCTFFIVSFYLFYQHIDKYSHVLVSKSQNLRSVA